MFRQFPTIHDPVLDVEIAENGAPGQSDREPLHECWEDIIRILTGASTYSASPGDGHDAT